MLLIPRFVQFSGLAGVIGGISVAFKQISPDVKLDLRVRQFRVQVITIDSKVLF